MELLKQKTLVVGACAIARELIDGEDAGMSDGTGTAPGYFLDVNGVRCGLIFTFWGVGNWLLVDRQFGTAYGEYETFAEAAAAIKDGAWVRKQHDETAAEDPQKAQQADASKEIYRIDNPLKGRPGITLLPTMGSALDMLNSIEPADLDEDEADDDWDDEDWGDEEDEEDGWIDAKVEDDAEIEDVDWAAAGDDDDDWEVTGDAEDDWDAVEDDDDDEDWDDDLDDDWDEDDDSMYMMPLEPRATYVVDVAKLPVAIYPVLTMGAVAWWEAFDVGTGFPLWSSQSLSELMRVAPLFLVVARSVNKPEQTGPYIETIMTLFDGLPRQTGEDYLRTGYLKANGREYLELMNRLYTDPLALEDAFAAATRSEGE